MGNVSDAVTFFVGVAGIGVGVAAVGVSKGTVGDVPGVVVADTAGSVGVLVAGLLVRATGDAWWDTMVALAIAFGLQWYFRSLSTWGKR